jgi:uncharacterized protein
MTAEEMLTQKVWAVVGVSQNPVKYGNLIYHKLKRHNYQVYAVNPKINSLDGDPVYASLASLPEKPAVIDMVVAPPLARQYLAEAAALGIQNVWFQPGTYDQDVLTLADHLGLNWVLACVLVASRKPYDELVGHG